MTAATAWEIEKQQRRFLLRDGIQLTTDQLDTLTLPNIVLAGFAFILIPLLEPGSSTSRLEATLVLFAYITCLAHLIAGLVSALLRIHLQSIAVGSVSDGRLLLRDNRWGAQLVLGLSGLAVLCYLTLATLLVWSRTDHGAAQISVTLGVLIPVGILVVGFWLFLNYKTDPSRYRTCLAKEVPDPDPDLLEYIQRFELADDLEKELAFACAKHAVTVDMLCDIKDQERGRFLKDIGISKVGERMIILEGWP